MNNTSTFFGPKHYVEFISLVAGLLSDNSVANTARRIVKKDKDWALELWHISPESFQIVQLDSNDSVYFTLLPVLLDQ